MVTVWLHYSECGYIMAHSVPDLRAGPLKSRLARVPTYVATGHIDVSSFTI